MKKHLIAAAVAGALAVPAMAQVTVKGTFDVTGYNSSEVETQASSTATVVKNETNQTGNNNGWSTSEVRFEGSEDLGGGLKASFALATGLGGGTSTFADRDRFIGLQGGFGTVRIGRLAPAAATGFHGYTAATTNAAGTTYAMTAASTTTDLRFGDDFTAGSFERNNNNIQYTSPSFGGVVVNLNYGSSTSDSSALAGSLEAIQQGLHIGYSAGPLSIGAAINKRDVNAQVVNRVTATDGNAGTAAVLQSSIDGELTWIGGSYNFGMATLGLARVAREDESTTAAGVSTKNSDVTLNVAGLTVPMGAITLRGSFYNGQNDGAAGTTDDFDLKGYQISALYALSKRTSAYFVMGQNKVERAGTNTGAGAREETANAIGITHSF
jgi:predicted porin